MRNKSRFSRHFTPTADGFVFESPEGCQSVRWADILQVVAYKKDCFAVDQLRLELRTRNGFYTATEDDEAWTLLVETLSKSLPGALSFRGSSS